MDKPQPQKTTIVSIIQTDDGKHLDPQKPPCCPTKIAVEDTQETKCYNLFLPGFDGRQFKKLIKNSTL